MTNETMDYELFNTATNEIEGSAAMTRMEARERNRAFEDLGEPLRWTIAIVEDPEA